VLSSFCMLSLSIKMAIHSADGRNEPKGSRKPTRTSMKTPLETLCTQADIQRGNDKHGNFEQTAPSTPNKSVPDVALAPLQPSSRKKPSGTPRSSKKVQLAAEQEKRHEYAVCLFNDLNRTVFKNGLPEDTKLNWNKRLLTTAGRAKWHRLAILFLPRVFYSC